MDVRRALLNAQILWYPIIQLLHRFTIAVCSVVVNHDGRVAVNHDGRDGSAPDPLVWDPASKRSSVRLTSG